jgi:hypothetical protein
MKLQNLKTTNDKYQELYDLTYKEVLERLAAMSGMVSEGQSPKIQDGRIGHLHRVSCGNFNEKNQFEVAHT